MDKCRSTIAIIEPSIIVSEGLMSLLLRSEKHYFFYKFDDLDELCGFIERENVDIVVANPIFFQNNLSLLSKLKRQYPEIFWIGFVYSIFDEKLLSMFDVNLTIIDSKERLSEIVRKAIKKQCSCNYSPHDDLSEREIDVLVLLIDGFSNKEIADKLCISVHTVVSHRKHISEKTGIKSLSGLTIYAISKKIVNPIF